MRGSPIRRGGAAPGSRDGDATAVLAKVLEPHLDGVGVGVRQTFRPFDGQHAVRGDGVETEVGDIAGSKSVQVDVIQRQPSVVLLDRA